MPDLRQIVADLLAQPVATTPPIEHVVVRARALRLRRRRQLTAATLAAFALTASVAVAFEREVDRAEVRLVGDHDTQQTTTTTEAVVGGWADDTTPASGLSGIPPRSPTSTMARRASGPTPGAGTPSSQSCRPAANGAWERGVTADSVEVVTGRSSSLLGTPLRFTDAHVGVTAVVNRVNREGGICGRRLKLRVVDDPSSTTGSFAVVAPGPDTRLHELEAAGIPAVGGVGLAEAQYSSRWAWPVGPSLAGTLRSMAQHAWDAGARTFGVAYEGQAATTIEGARAFREYVRQLPGAVVKADIALEPGKPGYGSEANQFRASCGSEGCDFVAMVLTPETANAYINSQAEEGGRKQGFGRMLTGAPLALLHERFARDCGKHCDGMLMWTGFTPPIGEHAGAPAIARYVDEVKSVDAGVDITNPFLTSAYVGAELLVQGLREAGSDLSRARLRDALDGLTHRSDLVTDLHWGPTLPSARVANTAVRAFRVTTASGSFVGFQDAGTGWRRDPRPGSFPS